MIKRAPFALITCSVQTRSVTLCSAAFGSASHFWSRWFRSALIAQDSGPIKLSPQPGTLCSVRVCCERFAML